MVVFLFSSYIMSKRLLCFSVRISFQEQNRLLRTNSLLRYVSPHMYVADTSRGILTAILLVYRGQPVIP